VAASKRNDPLSEMLDRALVTCANPQPPAGMQERIVATLVRGKGGSRKRLRIVCLFSACLLLGIAVRDGMHLTETVVSRFDGTPSSPPLDPVTEMVNPSPAPEQRAFSDASEELITDLEIEPLSISALELPSLSKK
jgi:hypothetical protein